MAGCTTPVDPPGVVDPSVTAPAKDGVEPSGETVPAACQRLEGGVITPDALLPVFHNATDLAARIATALQDPLAPVAPVLENRGRHVVLNFTTAAGTILVHLASAGGTVFSASYDAGRPTGPARDAAADLAALVSVLELPSDRFALRGDALGAYAAQKVDGFDVQAIHIYTWTDGLDHLVHETVSIPALLDSTPTRGVGKDAYVARALDMATCRLVVDGHDVAPEGLQPSQVTLQRIGYSGGVVSYLLFVQTGKCPNGVPTGIDVAVGYDTGLVTGWSMSPPCR